MKKCPICKSIDVPKDAEQCPFCLHEFENMKKTVKKPEAVSGIQTGSEAEHKKKNVTGQGSTQQSSTQQGSTQQGDAVKSGDAGNATSHKSGRYKSKKKGVGKSGFGKSLVRLVVYVAINIYDYVKMQKAINNSEFTGFKDRYIKDIDEYFPATDEEVNISEEAATEEVYTETEMEAAEEEEDSGDYILPHSNSAYVTEEDLAGLTTEELRLARNEIYARHGRRFNDSVLQEYFDSKEWYVGTIAPEDFSESVFNEYELANREFIKSHE